MSCHQVWLASFFNMTSADVHVLLKQSNLSLLSPIITTTCFTFVDSYKHALVWIHSCMFLILFLRAMLTGTSRWCGNCSSGSEGCGNHTHHQSLLESLILRSCFQPWTTIFFFIDQNSLLVGGDIVEHVLFTRITFPRTLIRTAIEWYASIDQTWFFMFLTWWGTVVTFEDLVSVGLHSSRE